MIRSCLRCSVRIGATIALLLFTLLGAILLKNFEFQKDLCDPNEGPSQLDVMFARIIREVRLGLLVFPKTPAVVAAQPMSCT
jgi:hypothetical protein